MLTDFCKSLTSIRQADVDAASALPDVLSRHISWLDEHRLNENNGLIVTCGDWDLGVAFPAQCASAVPRVEHIPAIYARWHNLKRSFCSISGREKAPGMSGMLNEMGLPLAGRHHRGIDDCWNIAALCKVLLQRGAAIEVTAELPPVKYPPITLRLRMATRVEKVDLKSRNLKALAGLAGKTFRCRVSRFHRLGGTRITDDKDLLYLTPGEEIELLP